MNSENINSSTTSDTDKISLKELILKIQEWWKYLLSKWLVIVICGLIGGGLGFVYAHFKKTQYIAVTTFVLEDAGAGGNALGSLSGLASMAGIDVGGNAGGIFQGDNILELYKSRSMIEKTLLKEVEYQGKKQLLINRYLQVNGILEKWAENPALINLNFKDTVSSRLRDSIMGTVVADIRKSYLNVEKPDKKLSIIRVEVKAPDEFFAKVFNDEIVRNVSDFYTQTKTLKSTINVSILKQKADSVRRMMNSDIYTAVAVNDATPNLNPTRQVQRIAPAQKSQFSAETNKAILSELVKNLELTKMSLLKETPLIQVVDEPVFPLTKVKFRKIAGIALGGIIAGFLACMVLVVRRALKITLQ